MLITFISHYSINVIPYTWDACEFCFISAQKLLNVILKNAVKWSSPKDGESMKTYSTGQFYSSSTPVIYIHIDMCVSY